MLLYNDIVNRLLSTANTSLQTVPQERFDIVVELIAAASRIFIHGAGRSGLAGRFLGMRLMHIGKAVHIVGDTTTPALLPSDLLILISASGKTNSVLHASAQGRKIGCRMLMLTAHTTASDPLSDTVILLPVPAVSRQVVNPFPLGTHFEVNVLLFLESVVAGLIEKNGITEADMQKQHANLE